MELDEVLREQTRYYRDRAAEYEDWWFRRGRYDRGAEANERWFADAAAARAALARFAPAGEVLDLACGTGLWTERLVEHADAVTAIDAAPEALALARERVRDERVEFVQADLFEWEPERVWDVCFFGFWLSHVPRERFAAFWEKVGRAVAPRGRVFFLDSLRSDLASAADHLLPDPEEQTMLRRLADGREYLIVKHFYEPAELQARIAALGWEVEVQATPEFFLHGQARLAR